MLKKQQQQQQQKQKTVCLFMSGYFSKFCYTVEYIYKYPCVLEDKWEAVKMDEHILQMKHFALNNAEE